MIKKAEVETTEEEKGEGEENPLLMEGKIFHIFPRWERGSGQAPNTKHQTSNNFQYSKFKASNKIISVIGNWCLKFVWGLECGVWCLLFFFLQELVVDGIDKGLPACLNDVFGNSHCPPLRSPIPRFDQDPRSSSGSILGRKDPDFVVEQFDFFQFRIEFFQCLS